MDVRRLTFSVNLYDEEGDKYSDCILLHLGNGTILSFRGLAEYDNFIEGMQYIREEIKDSL